MIDRRVNHQPGTVLPFIAGWVHRATLHSHTMQEDRTVVWDMLLACEAKHPGMLVELTERGWTVEELLVAAAGGLGDRQYRTLVRRLVEPV